MTSREDGQWEEKMCDKCASRRRALLLGMGGDGRWQS